MTSSDTPTHSSADAALPVCGSTQSGLPGSHTTEVPGDGLTLGSCCAGGRDGVTLTHGMP